MESLKPSNVITKYCCEQHLGRLSLLGSIFLSFWYVTCTWVSCTNYTLELVVWPVYEFGALLLSTTFLALVLERELLAGSFHPLTSSPKEHTCFELTYVNPLKDNPLQAPWNAKNNISLSTSQLWTWYHEIKIQFMTMILHLKLPSP